LTNLGHPKYHSNPVRIYCTLILSKPISLS